MNLFSHRSLLFTLFIFALIMMHVGNFKSNFALAVDYNLQRFGMAGYVDVNGSSTSDYRKWFVESGAQETAVGIGWSQIQPLKDGPVSIPGWLDETISACGKTIISGDPYSGVLQCHILFDSPPDWALISGSCDVDEKYMDSMAAAAAAVVKHFSDNTVGLQFLNEPDLKGCMSAENYAKALKKTYQAIKKINSQYPILMGRLASDPATYHSENFLIDVLNYSQDYLGGQFFDVLDLHFYDWEPQYTMEPFHSADSYSARVDTAGVSYGSNPGGGIRGKTIWARNLLTKYGIGNKPITYSEVGRETGSYTVTDQELQAQARAVFKLYVQALSVGVSQLSWYCLGDGGGGCQRATPNRKATNGVPADFSLAILNGGPLWESNPLFAGVPASFRPMPFSARPAYRAYQIIAGELTSEYVFKSLDETSGIEGYIFSSSKDNKKFKEVLWSRTGRVINKTFQTKKLTRIFLDGTNSTVTGSSKSVVAVSDPMIIIWTTGKEDGRPKLGDGNSDQKVNTADYQIWKSNYGKNVGSEDYTKANFNSDTIIDGLDYAIWFKNYGK